MCDVTRTTQNTLQFLVYSFLCFNFQYIFKLAVVKLVCSDATVAHVYSNTTLLMLLDQL